MEAKAYQVVMKRVEYDRWQFLELDNRNLLDEVTALRQQLSSLRKRNKDVEDALNTTELSPEESTSQRGARVDSSPAGPHTLLPTTDAHTVPVHSVRLPPGVQVRDVLLPGEEVTPQTTTTSLPLPATTPSKVSQANVKSPLSKPPIADDARSRSMPLPHVQPLPVRLPLLSQASLPAIAPALVGAGLVSSAKHRLPGAVASFLSNATASFQHPQPTWRAAFEEGFRLMRQRLLPPGPLQEWVDAWDHCIFQMGVDEESQLAWLLLLGLTLSAVGQSVVDQMRRLPVEIKLQILAFIPPGANQHVIMEFSTEAVETVVNDLWSAKREILSLSERSRRY